MRKIRLALAGTLLLCATTASRPALTIICPQDPVTTCNSCLYFGVQSSYQCTTFCFNGTLRRSCNTCGQGCNL
jgi:hypothetical protein